MKKGYIILAHKNPAQVRRLIDRLDDGRSTFFIHIDARAPLSDFLTIFTRRSCVRFVNTAYSGWGGFGLVEATINGMKAVRDSGIQFDRVILLSGQDYPIKSNDRIDDLLSDARAKVFMNYHPLPDYWKWPGNGGLYRVNKYYLGPGNIRKYIAKLLNFLSNFSSRVARKLPAGMRPFAGSQWWIMDMDMLGKVLDYISSHPRYRKFHQYTFAADEVFFHMIVLNSVNETHNVSNDSLRFMKWRSASSAHPEFLGAADLPALSSSPALFARKFDMNKQPEILDLIDEQLLA